MSPQALLPESVLSSLPSIGTLDDTLRVSYASRIDVPPRLLGAWGGKMEVWDGAYAGGYLLGRREAG